MTTLPLAEVRIRLSRLVESAVSSHERIEITRNGQRVAILMSADEYDSLLETLDVLSRPDELDAIREGLSDTGGDADTVISAEEMRSAMLARGRLGG